MSHVTNCYYGSFKGSNCWCVSLLMNFNLRLGDLLYIIERLICKIYKVGIRYSKDAFLLTRSLT